MGLSKEQLFKALVCRCLRAESGNSDAALRRVHEIISWRATNEVDEMLADPLIVSEEVKWRTLLCYTLPGLDRFGRPVMIEAVGRWDMAALAEAVQTKRDELM